MKASGISWIGEIPKRWTLIPLKWIAKTDSGSTPSSGRYTEYYEEGDIRWVRTLDLNNSGVWDTEIKITKRALKDTACKILPPGTVMVAMYGGDGTIGKHGILRVASTTNQAVCGIVFNKNHYPDFMHYYIQFYRPHWMVDAVGTRRDPNISQEIIRNLRIACPAYEEQKSIAQFLDRKTAAIAALIAKKQRLIELLEEKRSALINQAVTKGLNPDAPMKDSGIPWIGQVPQHWKILKLGRFAEVTKLTGFEYTNHWSVDPEGEIIALRGFNIKNNRLVLDDVERISTELSNKLYRSKLFAGDIVFPCTGTVGNGALIEEDNKFHINQNIAKITVRKTWSIDRKYLLHQLCSYSMKYQIDQFNSSGLQPVLLIGTIRNLTYVLPPANEQKAIARHLETQLNFFETIANRLQKQIERLQEYRQSIITAAVTGKLDVTQAAAL